MKKASIILTTSIPVGAFIIDRLTKYFAHGLTITAGTPMQTGIIDTVFHENHGIVANIPVPIPVIITVTGVIAVVIAIAWVRALRREKLLEAIGLGLILGGALSNLFDRTVNGYVYDWILLFGRSAINFADATIVLGAIIYAISLGTSTRNEHDRTTETKSQPQ